MEDFKTHRKWNIHKTSVIKKSRSERLEHTHYVYGNMKAQRIYATSVIKKQDELTF